MKKYYNQNWSAKPKAEASKKKTSSKKTKSKATADKD